MTPRDETIAVLQTPAARGGIAVIALIGPDAKQIIETVFRPTGKLAHSASGRLKLGNIVDGDTIIDQAIVAVDHRHAEINIHGGPYVARRTMELLAAAGARPTQLATDSPAITAPSHPQWNNPAIGAEMLTALPLARSNQAVAAITNQWSAGLSELASSSPSAEQLFAAASALKSVNRLLNPAEIVIVGPPNVGKSTLTNALVKRQVSIVHNAAGTTRDWVREMAILDGVPVYLTDTAGLWDTPCHVDSQAVGRAIQCAGQADIVLLVTSGEQTDTPDWLADKNVLRVSAQLDRHRPADNCDLAISAKNRSGIAELRKMIVQRLELDTFDAARPMAFTQRQQDLLTRAAESLNAQAHTTSDNCLASILRTET